MRISDAFGALHAVYQDWAPHVLTNPNYVRVGNSIIWPNFHPHMLEDPVSPDDVALLFEDGQYSFQVIDGALIQIRYDYNADGDSLQTASLAYLKTGVAGNDAVGWLRIDYDPVSEKLFTHPRCHLHLSLFPDSRFLVHGVPNPKQFVEFVISLCYPELYAARRISAAGEFLDEGHLTSVNSPCPTFDEDRACRYVTHVRIPQTPADPVDVVVRR